MTIDLSLAFEKVKKSRARKEKRQSRRLAKSRFYHSRPLTIAFKGLMMIMMMIIIYFSQHPFAAFVG